MFVIIKINIMETYMLTEVYMDSPLDFEDKFNSKVCKLKKPLYGLK